MSRYEATPYEYLFRDKRSGIYYFRGTVDGTFIDRSLKTTNAGEARTLRNAILGNGATPRRSDLRHSFNEAFDLLRKIQSTKAVNTDGQTKTQVEKHLRPWFVDQCPYLDTFVRSYEEQWADYKLHQRSVTPGRRLEHDRRYLVMALKRAFNRGWIKRDFKKKDFELNEAKQPIGQYIDDESVAKLLTAASKYPKLRLQILMALLMGMRISEILHLSLDEIDLKKREINLDPKRLKIRRPREVPIPIASDLEDELAAAVRACKGRYIFPAIFTSHECQPVDWNQPQDDNRYHWGLVRQASGVQVRFHDLRHTAITNLLKSGMPDVAVRKICGVSEQTMRRIYSHIESEMRERFRGAFQGKYTKGKS